MIAHYLRGTGLRVLGVPPDQKQFATATSERPDIIAADVGLLPSAVFDFCARVQRHEASTKVPIIAMTALADEGFAAAAKDTYCAAVLIKPCTPEALLTTIYLVLNRAPATLD